MGPPTLRFPAYLILAAVLGLGACSPDDEPSWEVVTQDLDGALLSVWGTSATDLWVVGGDSRDGKGPIVLHVVDGQAERIDTGETSGDLWWVFGFPAGPIYMGGANGLILRYESGSFTKMTTPSAQTVFGIWGSSPSDVWAVGGSSDARGGFAWRLQANDTWEAEPSLPSTVPDTGALWKIHGVSANDAWIVGSNGLSFHWNGQALEAGSTGVGSSLFTVFGNGERYVAVGGLASGIVVENDGSGWVDRTPDPLPESLTGVCLDSGAGGFAVGFYGSVYERTGDGWIYQPTKLGVSENLHGVWVDPEGGVWAAGGNTFVPPLTSGVLIHKAP
jgi:hypothetical protein